MGRRTDSTRRRSQCWHFCACCNLSDLDIGADGILFESIVDAWETQCTTSQDFAEESAAIHAKNAQPYLRESEPCTFNPIVGLLAPKTKH